MTTQHSDDELRKTVEDCIRHARMNQAMTQIFDSEVAEQNILINVEHIMAAVAARDQRIADEARLSEPNKLRDLSKKLSQELDNWLCRLCRTITEDGDYRDRIVNEGLLPIIDKAFASLNTSKKGGE